MLQLVEMKKSNRNIPMGKFTYIYHGYNNNNWITSADDPITFWRELFDDMFCFNAEHIQIIAKPKLTTNSIRPVINAVKKSYKNDTRGFALYVHDIFYGLVKIKGEENLSRLYDIFNELDIQMYI